MTDLALGLTIGAVLVVAVAAGRWAHRVYGWRGVAAVAAGVVAVVAGALGLRRKPAITLPPPPTGPDARRVSRTAGDIVREHNEAEKARIEADLAADNAEERLAARLNAGRTRKPGA